MGGEPKPFALCPAIERYGTSRQLKFFPSKAEAEEYLATKEPIQISPLDELFERENARLRRLHERGVCEDLESAPFPQENWPGLPKSIAAIPRSSYLVMVPVCCMSHHSGPACGLRAQERLRLDKIGQPPKIEIDEFFDIYAENDTVRAVRARRGEGNYDFVCCLWEDWRFDDIRRKARKGWGHHFAGNKYTTVAEILFGVIHDLEAAVRSVHKKKLPSAAAMASFWQSWQVQNHLAQICGDPNLWSIQSRISGLTPSTEICGLGGIAWPLNMHDTDTPSIPLLDTRAEREIDRARWWAYKSLWVLSHELQGSDESCCGMALGTDSFANSELETSTETAPALTEGQDARDVFANKETREAAVKSAAARKSSTQEDLANSIGVNYHDLRAWVRDRGQRFTKGGSVSSKVTRIEGHLLRFIPDVGAPVGARIGTPQKTR
jgi:hypothetical protein